MENVIEVGGVSGGFGISVKCIGTLSDRELLHRCELYGREALTWRNKFRALLPEVEKRKLYLKKGYSSVVEFGARLAGLSEAQVLESLNIMPRLSDKPMLKGLLESGEVSVNKITKVMSIATSENEAELAEKVQMLSKAALETFVRDIRIERRIDDLALSRLPGQKSESESIFMQGGENEFGLNEEVAQKLRELKEKGIDINEALIEFLDQRERQIEERKQDVAESLPEESGRHVPKRVKDVIQEEYGTKCAKSGCNKPSKELHHTARYGLTKSHDPNLLAPLCREHHEIAHKLDVRYVECGKKNNYLITDRLDLAA